MKSYVLAFDIGTTGAKTALIDSALNIKASAYHEYKTYYPAPGFVEQRPEDWWEAVRRGSREVIEKAKVQASEIACISLSGHMLGAVPVDRQGKLLRESVPIWADSRSTCQVKSVFNKIGGYRKFYQLTGGGHQPELYSIFKVMWYRDEEPRVFGKIAKILQSKDFIAYRLTGKMATDFSDASLTGALDIRTLHWAEEIFDAAGISNEIFPAPVWSSTVIGKLVKDAAQELGLKEGVPVAIGGGDGACAAAGAGAIELGVPFAYIGSASWLGVSTDSPVMDFDSRIVLLCHLVPRRYVPVYVMYSAGICQQWFMEQFLTAERYIFDNFGINPYEAMVRTITNVPADTPLIFLPYMRGGGAPFHNPDARGVFIGLDLNTDRAQLGRAVLEGVTLNLRLMADEMQRHSGQSFRCINVIGGGAKNRLWVQLIADALGCPVRTLLYPQEANCLGAAMAGGVAIGMFEDFEDAARKLEFKETYEARPEMAPFYTRKAEVFRLAYERLVPVFKELRTLGEQNER